MDVYINGKIVMIDVEEVIQPTEEKPYWQLIYKERTGRLCVPKESDVKCEKPKEQIRCLKVKKQKCVRGELT